MFLTRHPDRIDRYGELARIRGEEEAAFHVEFLAGALLADDPDAFESQARWTAGVLEARGIAAGFLAENLEQVRMAVAEAFEVMTDSRLDPEWTAGAAGRPAD